MPVPTEDELKEHRLEIEARTLLGVLTLCDEEDVINVAKVYVTYAFDGEPDWWKYDEHCGNFIVRMPADVDPWIASNEAAEAELQRRYPEASYTNIDDILAV